MLEIFHATMGLLLAAPAPDNTGGNADGVTAVTIPQADQTNIGEIKPDAQGLPGAEVAVTITSGIMFFSLLFCLVGLVLSAGLWAVGAFSNNYTQSVNGKKGFLICAGAALAIGAAYFLVSWFFNAGGQVK
jgi:hypothetical protein